VLFSRKHEIFDGAVPSANSVACENLQRLFRLTGDPAHAEDAAALARHFTALAREHPSAYGWFLCAVDRATGNYPDIVITGDTGTPETLQMIAAARSCYLPGSTLLFRSSSDPGQAEALASIAPFTSSLEKQDGGGGTATAFLCQGTACSLPVTDAKVLAEMLCKKGK